MRNYHKIKIISFWLNTPANAFADVTQRNTSKRKLHQIDPRLRFRISWPISPYFFTFNRSRRDIFFYFAFDHHVITYYFPSFCSKDQKINTDSCGHSHSQSHSTMISLMITKATSETFDESKTRRKNQKG